MTDLPASSLPARPSIADRRESMQRFEELAGRVLVAGAAALAIAMAAFICLTAHLLS